MKSYFYGIDMYEWEELLKKADSFSSGILYMKDTATERNRNRKADSYYDTQSPYAVVYLTIDVFEFLDMYKDNPDTYNGVFNEEAFKRWIVEYFEDRLYNGSYLYKVDIEITSSNFEGDGDGGTMQFTVKSKDIPTFLISYFD